MRHFLAFFQVLQGLLSVFKKDHSKVLIFSYSTRVSNTHASYFVHFRKNHVCSLFIIYLILSIQLTLFVINKFV